MRFSSTKIKDGYSTTFRQWKADGTHCKYLHGYGTSVRFLFEGELDERNWVADFGGFKRSLIAIENGMGANEWLSWLLDHTTIIAEDDPELERFRELEKAGIIQLRILPSVGAERFAEYIGTRIDKWIQKETANRVRLISCEFREHEKNSAIYHIY